MIPEIELCQVAVQVRFATVLIDALHAALEDRKVAFDCVGMGSAARPFVIAVVDGFVAGKLFAKAGVQVAFVGAQMGFAAGVADHDSRTALAVRWSTGLAIERPPRSTSATTLYLA